MSQQPTLVRSQFRGGVWEGLLSGAGAAQPELQVTFLDEKLDGLDLTHDAAQDVWRVRFAVPQRLLNEGVQTFVFRDGSGTILDSFTFLSGDVLAEDIRAEVKLLRSELELLKQSFRRHCSDG